jgi:hypothetical protein
MDLEKIKNMISESVVETTEMVVETKDEVMTENLSKVVEWYLSGGTYARKRMNKVKLAEHLGITIDQCKAMVVFAKKQVSLNMTQTGRAEFASSQLGLVASDVERSMADLYPVLMKLRDEIIAYEGSFATEEGFMLIRSFDSLLNTKNSFLGRKMDIIRTVFGTQNPKTNPIFDMFEQLGEGVRPLTSTEAIEYLDKKDGSGLDKSTGNQNLDYHKFMEMKAKGK